MSEVHIKQEVDNKRLIKLIRKHIIKNNKLSPNFKKISIESKFEFVLKIIVSILFLLCCIAFFIILDGSNALLIELWLIELYLLIVLVIIHILNKLFISKILKIFNNSFVDIIFKEDKFIINYSSDSMVKEMAYSCISKYDFYNNFIILYDLSGYIFYVVPVDNLSSEEFDFVKSLLDKKGEIYENCELL